MSRLLDASGNKKRTTVAIGIPSTDIMMAHTAICLTRLVVSAMQAGIQIGIINVQNSIVQMARDEIVRAAQKMSADYILFIDTDLTFPSDTLTRLLSHDVDVVGATYTRRKPPIVWLGHDLAGKRLDPVMMASGESAASKMPVKYLPSGLLLIRTDVFSNIPRADWFRVHINDQGLWHSEDEAFCIAAMKAGYAVNLDPVLSTEVGHLGVFEFGAAHVSWEGADVPEN